MKNQKNFRKLLNQRLGIVISIWITLMIPIKLIGQTIVPAGSVTGTWIKADSPYIITGNISVVDSLIINPGVYVQFQAGGWSIEVGSGDKFIARGSENDSIIFESYQGQAPGSWNAIYLTTTGADDILEKCIIRYGTIGISVYDSKPLINECIIYSNLTYGIQLNYQHTFENVRVSYCTIHDNGNSGVRFRGYDRYGAMSATSDIYRCKIYNNFENGVLIYSGTYWSSGSAYALARITNCTITGNSTGVRAYAYRGYADAQIINSIIANSNYGVVNQDSRSYIGENDIIYNCFWENVTANFSGLKNSISGFGLPPTTLNVNGDSCDVNYNLYLDPLFVDDAKFDFSLQTGSKCIDAGTAIILGEYVLDQDGTFPEMGAHYFNYSKGNLKVNPVSIDFGDVLVGNPELDSISVHNTGTGSLHINSIKITGTNPPNFNVDSTPLNIAAGDSQFLSVSFIPDAFGNFSASLQILSDGGNATVNLSGTGIDTSIRNLVIPDTFATQGDTFHIPIKITNALGVAGAEIKIAYDPTIITAVSASTTALTTDFAIADSVMSGKIAIAMASDAGLSGGSGDFVYIDFQVNANAGIGDTTDLTFESVSLYDENTNVITVDTKDGSLYVIPTGDTTIVEINISPKSDTLMIFDTRNFSASGKDIYGNTKELSVNWVLENKFGNIGNINPESGKSTLFTATGSGDGLIIATYDTLSDTAIVVVGKTKGDINLDDLVNVPDCIRLLQYLVGKYNFTLYQKWAADFNGDGSIDEADALMILTKSLDGLLPKVVGHGPAYISVGHFTKESEDLLTVPVLINGRNDVYAFGIEMTYDPNTVVIKTVTSTMFSSLIAANFNEPGKIKVSMVNKNGLINSMGEILDLRFKLKSDLQDVPELNINEVRLFNQNANRIETIIKMQQTEIVQIPQRFELFQNFPNPFNPITTIKYDLPENSNVRLIIYNMNGQEVRSLVHQNMNAGSHTLTWDARDNVGRLVPSGIYVYKIRVENGNWESMKKMILLK